MSNYWKKIRNCKIRRKL